MKNSKSPYILVSIFLTLLICASYSVVGYTSNKVETESLSLRGTANKNSFILGEPVKMDFAFINDGETDVIVPKYGVEVGTLRIFIADSDQDEYKEYHGAGWGRLTGARLTLKPKQSHKFEEAVIYWNGKPNVSHLNSDAAKEVLKGKITSEYVFPKPGIYFVKGVSYTGENFTPFESDPVKIVVKKPVGENLAIWNQIKGNRDIAYLIQNSYFRTEIENEKAELVKKVEQIIEQYPNSTYSIYLKTNLEEYKKKEEIIKENRRRNLIIHNKKN